MMGFVALKFSILIAKSLFNAKSVSFNLAFMPVANKVCQEVKTFILRFLSEKYNRRLTRVVKNLYSKSIFNNFVFQCLLILFQGNKCMDSLASDSRKEIACISNFSKLSKKKQKKITKKTKNKKQTRK